MAYAVAKAEVEELAPGEEGTAAVDSGGKSRV